MPIYNHDFETMPRREIEAVQLKRLQATIERIYATVPFYKNSFDKAGIKPENIKGLDDLQRIPFTTKLDLRDNYPYDMFAVPMEQVVRIHASSGTTGKPTVVGYTQNDLNTWAELMARSFSASGYPSVARPAAFLARLAPTSTWVIRSAKANMTYCWRVKRLS